MPIKSTKQNWSVGEIINVGFMKGFKIEEICAVKDFLPDIYILSRNGKWYEFIPHNRLTQTQNCRECTYKDHNTSKEHWCYMFGARVFDGCGQFNRSIQISIL